MSFGHEIVYTLTLYLIETPFNTFAQTEQTQTRQLLQKLPDHGLLCLLIEIWLDMILH